VHSAVTSQRRRPGCSLHRRGAGALAARKLVLTVLPVLVVAVVAGACGGTSPASRAGRSSSSTAAPAPTSTTVPVTTTTAAPVTTTIAPGLLPQTHAEPPVGSSLGDRLEPLWRAIVTDSLHGALPLFFPERAYLRMKTGLLPDPAADYADRLIGFYRLDLVAYHAALGAKGASARLLGVKASPADASWIGPGACENLIGYWHLPGVRLVYEEHGVVRSFAVASLISWRGVWYVVHLGPNPRPVNVGTVDEPSLGAGTPGPAGGC
jgi:hypothetical protein